LTDTVMIGSDRYETEAERQRNHEAGLPCLNVGDRTVIDRAILDKDCRIGRGVRIVNESKRVEYDDPSGMWHVRDGIVCIPRGAVIPDGTVI
jgi:glucose-1-phosphate adenylyltransferase